MKIKRGSTSVRRLIFIGDSSSTTGAGLASLAHNSAGLAAYYFAGDLSNEVAITLATATLGTYTSGGFIAVDNTNMPGWYEIGIPDAALDGGNECVIQLRGATNMAPVNIYIELDAVDYQTAIFGAMASYTQPTGFLAATFPSDPADQSLVIAAADAILTQVNLRSTQTSVDALPTVAAIANEVQTRTIARVTLVDTCTTNTDMRGTDSAATAANLTALKTVADKIATVIYGTVTGAGTATEVFVSAGYTVTVTVDASGNRSSVVIT